ncbi:MAG TPA: glycosyltransferase [Sphingomonas sp.]
MLHVITGLNVGGAEAMLARLIERDRLFGLESEVVTLMPAGVAGERMIASGVSVQSLGMHQGLPSFAALSSLAGIVRSSAPDVVMAWMHHAQAAVQLAMIGVGRKIPVIWNVRHSLSGFAQEKLLTRVTLRALAFVSRRPAAIIYNAEAAARQYREAGFRPEREVVIPNGFAVGGLVDPTAARARLQRTFGLKPGVLTIGMIARAHPMKDVPTLVTAFAATLGAGIEAQLLLAGEGMDRPDGAIAAGLAGLPRGSWMAVGHRSDVGGWLAGLDMLVLPSAWGEGFPNIVGEAMTAGVPCVATDVGDAGRLIGDTGRLVPPRDPAALAVAMIELAQLGRQGRAGLGSRARERVVRHYEIEAIAQRYQQLYASVAIGTAGAIDPQVVAVRVCGT